MAPSMITNTQPGVRCRARNQFNDDVTKFRIFSGGDLSPTHFRRTAFQPERPKCPENAAPGSVIVLMKLKSRYN